MVEILRGVHCSSNEGLLLVDDLSSAHRGHAILNDNNLFLGAVHFSHFELISDFLDLHAVPDGPNPSNKNHSGKALKNADEIGAAAAAILVIVRLDDGSHSRCNNIVEEDGASVDDGVDMIVAAHFKL